MGKQMEKRRKLGLYKAFIGLCRPLTLNPELPASGLFEIPYTTSQRGISNTNNVENHSSRLLHYLTSGLRA